MAPAIVHFLVGASLLLLLATPVALRYSLPPQWPLWLVAIGGLWGLAPDLHQIAPIYRAQLYAIHNSPLVDAFAFHYTLDRPAVRARPLASTFFSILLFLGSVGAFSLAASLQRRDASAETNDPYGSSEPLE